MARKPADPEEELRWMAQEVRGYVEAVLNSLAANVPKVFVHVYCLLSYICDMDILNSALVSSCDCMCRQLFFAKWKKLKKTC